MRELFSVIAALAAVCTAVHAVCPEGEIKKYIRLCCVLCAVTVLASFLPERINLPDTGLPAYAVEDISAEAACMVIDRALSNIEDAVYDAAKQKYGVERDDLSVEAVADRSDTSSVKLVMIKCRISGLKNTVIMKSLENFIADRFGCGCEVEYTE
jgi:hypothetical protein